MDKLTAAWTSNKSWQRLSQELMFDASRMPERTGISSFVDIWVRVGGGEGTCGGVITQGGIPRGC